MFVWYFLQDNGQWGSGLLKQNGQAKPAAEVFSLPMGPVSTKPVSRTGTVTLVGQARDARGPSQVSIQRKGGDDWITIATVQTTKDGSFAAKIVPGSTGTYRATWTGDVPSGSQTTRTSWPVTVKVKSCGVPSPGELAAATATHPHRHRGGVGEPRCPRRAVRAPAQGPPAPRLPAPRVLGGGAGGH